MAVEFYCENYMLFYRRCDSISELKASLEDSKDSVILEGIEQKESLILHVKQIGIEVEKRIGLSCGTAMQPKTLISAKSYNLWICLDTILYVLDVSTLKVMNRCEFIDYIWDFYQGSNYVTAIRETGLSVHDLDGYPLSEHTFPDKLHDYSINEDIIVVRCDSGEEKEYNLLAEV